MALNLSYIYVQYVQPRVEMKRLKCVPSGSTSDQPMHIKASSEYVLATSGV